MTTILEDLKARVALAQKAVDNWEIDTEDKEVIALFEAMLEESYGDRTSVCGHEFGTVYLLKQMDDVAYSEDLNNFVDGLDKEAFDEYNELVDELAMAEEELEAAEMEAEELADTESDEGAKDA